MKHFNLSPILKPSETYISVRKALDRAKKQGIHSGKAETDYLLNHQDEIPKGWRQYYLVFPEYLLDDYGYRSVAYFCWDERSQQWVLYFHWDGSLFHRNVRFVVPREPLDTGELGTSLPLKTLESNGKIVEDA